LGWKVGRDGNAPIGDLFRFELVSMAGTAKKHILMLLEGVSDESRLYICAMSRAFEVIIGGSRSQKRDAHGEWVGSNVPGRRRGFVDPD
jgi:hypothetical protein